MTIRLGSFVLLLMALSLSATAQNSDNQFGGWNSFTLSSTTFADHTTLPLSMIYNNIVSGSNICSLNGAPGGNESPELTWSNAPRGTASFVVTLYDTTAAFTHWGMYNISPKATGLPENAGVAGSPYGEQILNDFGVGDQYDGPCPPAGYEPYIHHYVFTVYALGTPLRLPSSTNFPANAETLYHALIRAGEKGEILAHASIVGYYSTTPTK